MTTSFSRLGSANTYDNALRNISNRQSALSSLQENLTSGKKVVRASDDPTSAAQAERALNRISRIQTDQRALESQRNSIVMAESTLGDVTNALQNFRELVVTAGNGTLTAADRKTIALQLTGLRDQVFALANSKDTNGRPLFSALGSALAPFVGPTAPPQDYTFNGLPGQSASNEVAIPFTLDGDSAFMHQATRDAVFNATVGSISAGRQLSTDSVVITNPGVAASTAQLAFAASGGLQDYPSYTIAFTAVDTTTTPGTTTATYSITENPAVSGAIAPVTVSYPTNKSIAVTAMPGLSLTITGTPAVGDTVTVEPSPSIFSVLDNAIRDIGSAANGNAAAQAVSQALGNIDIGMGRVSAIRGQAGDLLNRADSISANQDKRSIQLEADRSRAEDLDMVKGISDFQKEQTGYQAALQSYAQVQKLSLFNYIS
ncbi:flagellar hook-associated protein FlgL [Rhodoferax sp.]|uniref:flagellar hook-associated protein FlgL n=1 Tax=Rhodoferax sp. TaxID=50421 RepID=UPI00271B3D27|nr:flagellar hook-associated protein FlgL [Rhodoferax sp.]MDO9195094.1 flagellar hook-associated protein FlgL [Rhodoferax sp.]